MTISQMDKARAFMALHERPGCFVIPKDWTYPCRFLPWFVITCETLGNRAFTGLPRLLHSAAI